MKNITRLYAFGFILILFLSSSANSESISQADKQACLACHKGTKLDNSTQIEDQQIKGPQLGGLKKDYIFQQLLNFQEGRRNNNSTASKEMTNAVKDLQLEKIHSLAKWASKQNSKETFNYSNGKNQFGKKIYTDKCKGCHDSFMGRTMTGSPALSYLRSDYIINQLKDFSQDLRNFKSPNKHQIKMKAVVKNLTDIEFQLLSTFIKDTVDNTVTEATQ
jgi:cytochrome c553